MVLNVLFTEQWVEYGRDFDGSIIELAPVQTLLLLLLILLLLLLDGGCLMIVFSSAGKKLGSSGWGSFSGLLRSNGSENVARACFHLPGILKYSFPSFTWGKKKKKNRDENCLPLHRQQLYRKFDIFFFKCVDKDKKAFHSLLYTNIKSFLINECNWNRMT